jgi:hypothetical protein
MNKSNTFITLYFMIAIVLTYLLIGLVIISPIIKVLITTLIFLPMSYIIAIVIIIVATIGRKLKSLCIPAQLL